MYKNNQITKCQYHIANSKFILIFEKFNTQYNKTERKIDSIKTRRILVIKKIEP